MGNYKFSGHETFQCRHFWLKKGYDFISLKKDFKSNEALIDLGVGKNMVTSMSYWLKAFKISDDKNEPTELGVKLFGSGGFDPYLEDVGSQYILHYNITQNQSFASIYRLTFDVFRKTRIANEFTETQLLDFVIKLLAKDGDLVSPKSIANDIKVLTRMYLNNAKRGSKSIEDDYASLLIGLNLIHAVEGVYVDGAPLFKLNYCDQRQLDKLIFLFLILDKFETQRSISLDLIQSEISDLLLCNREGTEAKIEELAEVGFLVYKSDAGRREIQLKDSLNKWNILGRYYGRV
jgi:Protein of unknown function (DUF4007)